MFRRKLVVGGAAALIVAVAYLATLQAQEGREMPAQGKEVTLHGKIVDMQCYMTGEYPSADKVRCTRECIRAGVPAALETEKGLVILGKGQRGPAQMIVPYAFQEVDVRGKLYERNGTQYIDLLSVTPPSKEEEGESSSEEEEESED